MKVFCARIKKGEMLISFLNIAIFDFKVILYEKLKISSPVIF